MSETKVKTSADQIKEILEGVVNDKFVAQRESDQKMIEESIAKAIAEETAKAKKIEVEDNFEKDPKGGFKSFAHFCRDVARSDQSSGRNESKELDKWNSLVKAAGTGLSEGNAEYAGHLVPEEFRNTLMVAVEESNDILPRCTVMPMQTNIIKIPYVDGFDKSAGLVYGGVQWYWTAEEGSFTETRPKVQMLQLELHKLTGLAYVTDELLADSPQSIEALLQRGFQDGLNYVYNEVLIHGTGAGQPLGVVNAPCAVSVTAETGQVAATIVWENIIKMFSSAMNPSRCVWVANINCLPQLASMSLAVGTGGVPVWMPAGGASGMPYNTLMGLPLFFNDHASTLGTVGDLMLVDWSQYLIGRKAGGDIPRFDTSIHLKFDYGQTAFRFQIRTEGRPWWKTYYTPPKATTDYRSPVVLLATRS